MGILAVLFLIWALAGPTADGIDWTIRPADWPTLEKKYIYTDEVVKICSDRIGRFGQWEGCATPNFKAGTCEITLYPNGFEWVVRHEEAHCDGYDHPGESTIRDEWEVHKQRAKR